MPMHATLSMRFVRTLSRFVIVSCVRICRLLRLFDWQITKENTLPPAGQPLLFVSNHIEWHDIPFIGWAIPARYNLWWFAKAELFDHWMGWWFRCLPMIPVRRSTGDTTALAAAIHRVSTGCPLVIFPEGTWDDGRILRAKTGVVRIALATNALIVPLALTGRQQPLWFHKRTLRIGAPFRMGDLPSYIPSASIDQQPIVALTTDVMHHITALLPTEYHGYYTQTH
jgi:1-acyl-sn-glycerol-3-phosphate acyltransferase